MKIIAIKDMSVGNETVGDMWKETVLFHRKVILLIALFLPPNGSLACGHIIRGGFYSKYRKSMAIYLRVLTDGNTLQAIAFM